MKQHITKEQYLEINTIYIYGVEKEYTIGKMIEILDAENYVVNINSSEHTVSIGSIKQGKTFNNKQLCDSLWQAVKYILGGE